MRCCGAEAMGRDYPVAEAVRRPWEIVATGFIALALAFSARAALSLVMPAWQTEFGWSRSAVSGVAAAAMLVMALVAPVAGNLVDRHGSRRVLAAGLTAIPAGLLVATLARPGSTAWLLPLGFAGIAAAGFGLVAQHVVAAAIARRFDRQRGLATGIGTAGSTAGQLLLLPLLALLLEVSGWRAGFVLLALASLILVPLVLRLEKEIPRDVEEKGNSPEALGARLWLLARMPAFHALFWSYLICGFTTSGMIETHFLPFAAYCGFPPVLGATAFGILSGVNLLGMILAGGLADHVSRPLLLAAIYLARAGCFALLLFLPPSLPLLMVFAVLFGLFDYSTVPVTAGLMADRAGIGVVGLAMGLLSAGHAIGGAAGALAGGTLVDLFGTYASVWTLCTALAFLAAVMVLPLRDRIGSKTTSQVQA